MQSNPVRNINNVNIAPWGIKGYTNCKNWCSDNLTKSNLFYAKWIDLTYIPYNYVYKAHKLLFDHDIEKFNDANTVFSQAVLVYLYLNSNLSQSEVKALYKTTYERMGTAIESHEDIYLRFGCNLSQLVLVAELLELQREDINEILKKLFSKDRYISMILNGELNVPERINFLEDFDDFIKQLD